MRRYTYPELVEATAQIPDGTPEIFPPEADQWAEFLPGASPDHKRFAWLNMYISAAITRVGYSPEEHGITMDEKVIVANGAGLCGQVAHVFVSVARALDYPARRVGLYEIAEIDHPTLTHSCHAVAEVCFDEGWRLFDPTTGVYFVNAYDPGLPLSVEDVRRSAKDFGQRLSISLQAVHPPHLYAPSGDFPLGQLVDPAVYARGKMELDDE